MLTKKEIKELERKPYISTRDYARLMELNSATVARNCRKGEIKGATKVGGGSWRIANPLYFVEKQ